MYMLGFYIVRPSESVCRALSKVCEWVRGAAVQAGSNIVPVNLLH